MITICLHFNDMRNRTFENDFFGCRQMMLMYFIYVGESKDLGVHSLLKNKKKVHRTSVVSIVYHT